VGRASAESLYGIWKERETRQPSVRGRSLAHLHSRSDLGMSGLASLNVIEHVFIIRS
jgi:hypothetical protein